MFDLLMETKRPLILDLQTLCLYQTKLTASLNTSKPQSYSYQYLMYPWQKMWQQHCYRGLSIVYKTDQSYHVYKKHVCEITSTCQEFIFNHISEISRHSNRSKIGQGEGNDPSLLDASHNSLYTVAVAYCLIIIIIPRENVFIQTTQVNTTPLTDSAQKISVLTPGSLQTLEFVSINLQPVSLFVNICKLKLLIPTKNLIDQAMHHLIS